MAHLLDVLYVLSHSKSSGLKLPKLRIDTLSAPNMDSYGIQLCGPIEIQSF